MANPSLYIPERHPIAEPGGKITRPWLHHIQGVVTGLAGAGDVDGPGSSTDNAIARWNGTTGTVIQDSGITIADGATGTLSGTNTGDVTLAGTPNYITIAAQVITRALINLASHVTGRLPFANLTAATAASKLLGRRSGSAGDFEEITLGSGLTMTGTTISSSSAAATATYLTVSDETATLANSRRELAGNNISLDDSVANVRTVTAGAWRPLTTGAEPMEFISDGMGVPLMLAFTA